MGFISDDDRALFRASVEGARPVRRQDRVAPTGEPPAPEPAQTDASERRVLEELLTHEIDPAVDEAGEALEYLRPGLQTRVLKRLKRGRFTIGDELDLHHLRATDARRCLGEFLAEARTSGIHCVRVVHGKGRRSRGGQPVLRQLVGGFLRRHPLVLAFTAAPESAGGSGAVIVLLAR